MKRSPFKPRKTGLNPVSAKRKITGRIYARQASAFKKAHPVCQVCYCSPTADVHHTAGRYGGNYLEESTWLAVCRECHNKIHDNPIRARALGWLKDSAPLD